MRQAAVLACLVAALASGANPDGLDITKNINEAIDAQMQDAAASGKGQAASALADLAEYAHGEKSHQWEKRAISAIRGMSQSKMAVSDLSDTELKFAQDAEEAKDIVDQTAQAATLKVKQQKQDEAAAIKAQLADAQRSLTQAAHANDELAESDDVEESPSDVDTHMDEDPSVRGPMDGGIFMLEDSEDEDDDFEPSLSAGTSMQVEQDIQSAILQQTNLELNGAKAHQNNVVDTGLKSLAEDTENAQAAVQEMKAQIKTPVVNLAAAKEQGREEAEQDADEDVNLGSSQAEQENADEQAKASKQVDEELKEAQEKLLQAQNGMN
jgi:hypothetical protein